MRRADEELSGDFGDGVLKVQLLPELVRGARHLRRSTKAWGWGWDRT
jgi:hypothetical protein